VTHGHCALAPRLLRGILPGGIVAGILDGLDATIFYKLAFGVPPAWLFQNIASGLLGRASFRGGWPTVFLGVGLHFSIAIGAAAVFCLAGLLLSDLYKRPFLYGPAFGIAIYLFMHHVVLPLSALAPRTVPVTHWELADQLFSHMFFVGLPIALAARHAARAS